MAALQKIPEGIFYISSQGHFRYGNSVNDEEWVIPASKIKLSESSLSFGKAITSNGYYTDIKDKSKEVIVDELFMIYVGDDVLSSKLNIKDGETNVVLFVGVNGINFELSFGIGVKNCV